MKRLGKLSQLISLAAVMFLQTACAPVEEQIVQKCSEVTVSEQLKNSTSSYQYAFILDADGNIIGQQELITGIPISIKLSKHVDEYHCIFFATQINNKGQVEHQVEAELYRKGDSVGLLEDISSNELSENRKNCEQEIVVDRNQFDVTKSPLADELQVFVRNTNTDNQSITANSQIRDNKYLPCAISGDCIIRTTEYTPESSIRSEEIFKGFIPDKLSPLDIRIAFADCNFPSLAFSHVGEDFNKYIIKAEYIGKKEAIKMRISSENAYRDVVVNFSKLFDEIESLFGQSISHERLEVNSVSYSKNVHSPYIGQKNKEYCFK